MSPCLIYRQVRKRTALQFSLRALFTATTLIAIPFAMVSVHPGVLIVSLLFLSPFLLAAAMASLSSHVSPSKRLVLTVVGVIIVLCGIIFGIEASKHW
jgi:hypothetical protein